MSTITETRQRQQNRLRRDPDWILRTLDDLSEEEKSEMGFSSRDIFLDAYYSEYT